MTLEDAVATLNLFRYRGRDNWQVSHKTEIDDLVYSSGWPMYWLIHGTAIDVARRFLGPTQE